MDIKTTLVEVDTAWPCDSSRKESTLNMGNTRLGFASVRNAEFSELSMIQLLPLNAMRSTKNRTRSIKRKSA